MAKNDGGAAFPRYHFDCDLMGMTLRDYFAAKAPITLSDVCRIMGQDFSPHKDDDLEVLLGTMAELRYEYADAMLKARDEEQNNS